MGETNYCHVKYNKPEYAGRKSMSREPTLCQPKDLFLAASCAFITIKGAEDCERARVSVYNSYIHNQGAYPPLCPDCDARMREIEAA